MTVLSIAVAVLAVLTVLNLLLVVGLSRRLRELAAHEGEHHAAADPAMFDIERDLPQRGRQIGEAVLVAPGAGQVDLSTLLSGRRTIVLVSTSCSACTSAAEQLALAGPDRLHNPLVIVEGMPGTAKTEEYLALFAPLADVVIDPTESVAGASFGLDAYPAYVLADDSTIVTASYRLPQLVGDELALTRAGR